MPLSDRQLSRLSPDELVIIIIEEAAEVLQAATKAMRFGLEGKHPDREDANVVELCGEAEQVGAAARILGANFGINYAATCDRRQRDAERMWGDEATKD